MEEILQPDKESRQQRQVALGGMGGVGKTHLALALMERVVESCAQVRMTTQQQRSATEQVVSAMEQITVSSRQVSATAQEIAAAAAAQAGLAGELDVAVIAGGCR